MMPVADVYITVFHIWCAVKFLTLYNQYIDNSYTVRQRSFTLSGCSGGDKTSQQSLCQYQIFFSSSAFSLFLLPQCTNVADVSGINVEFAKKITH